MEMHVLAKLPWESLTNLRRECWSLWRQTTAWVQGVSGAECLQTELLAQPFYLTVPFYLKKKKSIDKSSATQKINLKSSVCNPKAPSLPGLCRERSQHSPSCPEGTGMQDLDRRLPKHPHAQCSGLPSPTIYLTLDLLSWTQEYLTEPIFLPFSLNMPG